MADAATLSAQYQQTQNVIEIILALPASTDRTAALRHVVGLLNAIHQAQLADYRTRAGI